MLTAGNADQPRLPQTDLVYVAFRICCYDLLTELETEAVLGVSEFDEGSYGFLTCMPMFEAVAPVVQLDLLASVWARHHSPMVQPADLLDAAVLWAIFNDAGRIGRDVWDGDLSVVLEEGPRPVSMTMNESLVEQWQMLFEEFWDDVDFLCLEEMLDMPPDEARAMRRLLGIPEAWVDEMLAVLNRTRASGAILKHLRGLLSDAEIADHHSLLLPGTG
jgi:hypothetical protein